MLFLSKPDILLLHSQLIQLTGGSDGVRDEGALEAAISAPQQRAYYEGANLVACAATYAYHLCQAHAFIDGNKRVAAAACELFIDLNGHKLTATDNQLIDLFLSIAAGIYSREQVEQMLGSTIAPNES